MACYELQHRAASLNLRDIDVRTTRGSGPGGQNRNKVETCVIVVHRPTGITIRIDGRSQLANKKLALELLELKLMEFHRNQNHSKLNDQRKSQIGSGQRGDKIRTYRFQDNLILNHVTGEKTPLDRWMKGL